MGRLRRGGARWVVAAGLFAVAAAGCSPTSLWWLMNSGNDKKAPEIPLPPKEGKKEVTVAILASASPTLGMDPSFAGAERELAGLIGTRMVEETKEDRHPIRVIDQSKVEKLKLSSPQDWRAVNPAVIGKQLGADYVIDLTLTGMSIFQPEYGQELYQGRANVQVVVYDTAHPEKPFQDYIHPSIGEQKSTAGISPVGYRKWFIGKVATEIAHRHIPYVAVRELPPLQ